MLHMVSKGHRLKIRFADFHTEKIDTLRKILNFTDTDKQLQRD